jgi:hypothetical protein
MGILLAFAPFIVYVIIERLAGITPGLVAATLTSMALLIRDGMSRQRKVKILEIGTALLFGGLAAYSFFSRVVWSIPAVRLRVDAGLLLVVLISISLRRPFTLQYAREEVPQNLWTSPEFVRTNYIITAVWALAFALMVAMDMAMLYLPGLSTRVAIIVTIVVIWAAAKFTSWYPDRKRRASQASARI